MRSRATLLAMALLLGGCTGQGGTGPRMDPPPTLASPAASPQDAEAVLASVRAFLDAYGRGPAGRGALAQQISGPHLEEWVRLLHLQPPGDESATPADLDIRDLRLLDIRGDGAQVTLDATVTHPGSTPPISRIVQSPMDLVRDLGAPAGWSVVDAVRDGRPMRRSITLYREAATTHGRLGVEVRSVYQFTSGTVANVRIANRTGGPLRIDRPHSLLQAAGRFVGSTAASAQMLESIPPGGTVEGAFRFHTIPLDWVPEKLMVHFVDDAAGVLSVDLPFEEFLASRG